MRRRIERDRVEAGGEREDEAPAPASAEQLLRLQRTAGNQAVQRLVARARADQQGLVSDEAVDAFSDYNAIFKQFNTKALDAGLAHHGLDTPETWEAHAQWQQMGPGPHGAATADDKTFVHGLDEEELAQYLLTPGKDEEGQQVFYWAKTGKALNTVPMKSTWGDNTGRAIFVMTMDGKLYAADQTAETGKVGDDLWRFHHSSFLNGQPIAAAGEIVTDEKGVLKGISDQSGHYKPEDKFMVQMLKNFVADGVDISNVTVELYDPAGSVAYPAPKLIEHNGNAAAMRAACLEEIAATGDVMDRNRDPEGGWYWRANGNAVDRDWENRLIAALAEGRSATDVFREWTEDNPHAKPIERTDGKKKTGGSGYVN